MDVVSIRSGKAAAGVDEDTSWTDVNLDENREESRTGAFQKILYCFFFQLFTVRVDEKFCRPDFAMISVYFVVFFSGNLANSGGRGAGQPVGAPGQPGRYGDGRRFRYSSMSFHFRNHSTFLLLLLLLWMLLLTWFCWCRRFFFCSATSFASVPSAAGHGVADDARGVADAATGGGARLGVSAAARDHGRLCALPLQDPARLARPGAALGRQRYRKTDELRTS